MIKPVVGKVKSPAYALPDKNFVYGIESKLDKEGAGEGEEREIMKRRKSSEMTRQSTTQVHPVLHNLDLPT